MVTVAYIASFFVLCIMGLANASYLMWKHYQKKPLVCPLNHKCGVVTESRWSHIFGVRNEIIGVVFFGSLILGLMGVLLLPTYAGVLVLLIRISCGLSLVFSSFLVFVQFKIIKDYCFYCLISTLIVLLLVVNSFGL